MGAFRLLLALAVVSMHSGRVFGLIVLHGDAVVQAFFIVSGFYMGLVLDTTYANSTASFYANRLLRLGPTYLVAVTLSFLTVLITRQLFYSTTRDFAEFSRTADAWLVVVILVTNLFIVGQEWAVFLPTRDVHPSHPGVLHFYELIPQGWSIALELYFYAMAPFLARLSTRVLWGIVVASGALRLLMSAIGFDHRWQVRIEPLAQHRRRLLSLDPDWRSAQRRRASDPAGCSRRPRSRALPRSSGSRSRWPGSRTARRRPGRWSRPRR